MVTEVTEVTEVTVVWCRQKKEDGQIPFLDLDPARWMAHGRHPATPISSAGGGVLAHSALHHILAAGRPSLPFTNCYKRIRYLLVILQHLLG